MDQEYFSFKAECTHEADLDSLEPSFPLLDVEDQSTLIGYGEVLPFQTFPTFQLGGATHHALDMYCVNRSCHCNTVNLIIAPADSDDDDDEMFLAVDLTTGGYKVQGALSPHLCFTPAEAIGKVWSVYDLDTFRQRYIRMRKWYESYFERHAGEYRSFSR